MDINEIIASKDIDRLRTYLETNKLKVGSHRRIIKMISKTDWSTEEFPKSEPTFKWYRFNIDLLRIPSVQEQLEYIDANLDYFDSWYSVDGTLMNIKRKDMDFNLIYKYSKRYIKDKNREFVCRLGYIYFFMNLINKNTIEKIASLLHDDDRYYVQMGEAWLLCEMVTKCPEEGYNIIKNSKLKYNILGKAIQKCCDSFRIDDEMKENLKKLRYEKRQIV